MEKELRKALFRRRNQTYILTLNELPKNFEVRVRRGPDRPTPPELKDWPPLIIYSVEEHIRDRAEHIFDALIEVIGKSYKI